MRSILTRKMSQFQLQRSMFPRALEQVFTMSFHHLINKQIIIVISLVFLFVPPLWHYPKVQSKASSGKVPSNPSGRH
jgi:hypothetical protein